MADSWTCGICEKQLRCSCQSSECAFSYDIKDHILTHECQCDFCSDENCECRTAEKCLVCQTKEYKGPMY